MTINNTVVKDEGNSQEFPSSLTLGQLLTALNELSRTSAPSTSVEPFTCVSRPSTPDSPPSFSPSVAPGLVTPPSYPVACSACGCHSPVTTRIPQAAPSPATNSPTTASSGPSSAQGRQPGDPIPVFGPDADLDPSTRWYVVTVGSQVGVYAEWYNVAPHVVGIKGSCYFRVSSRAEGVKRFGAAESAGNVRVLI